MALGAHAGLEQVVELFLQLPVLGFGQDFQGAQVFQFALHLIQLLLQPVFFLFGGIVQGVAFGLERGGLGYRLRVFGFFQGGQLFLQFGKLFLAVPLQLFPFQVELEPFFLNKLGPLGIVHRGDDVLGEVKHPFQVARGQVEEQAQPAGRGLAEPDVRHRRGQADVAHPLPAHLGAGNLDAAAVADHAPVADALVLAAETLPILGRPKEPLTEQAVLLRAQRPIVYGLRLGHLAMGPVHYLFRRGDGNANSVKVGCLDFRAVLHPDH